ncbi:MAG: sirohydrochlorin chelatase [Polyangiales bacterium]
MKQPRPTTALLLIDHGSRRAAANRTLAGVAALFRAELGDTWMVTHAHMELAPPTVADALADCAGAGVQEVFCLPYMLAPGRHATEDIPAQVRQAATAHPELTVHCTAPLGLHPGMLDIVLQRCGRNRRAAPTHKPCVGDHCRGEPATCQEPHCYCALRSAT